VLTTTLDVRELNFLIRQIDEYIQVTEFMIRKTAASDHGELALARNLRTKLSPGKQTEEQARLGGASLVSMMKSAHLRNFHNKTVLRLVDGSRLRRIFGQG
jgi:hypothetical protein